MTHLNWQHDQTGTFCVSLQFEPPRSREECLGDRDKDKHWRPALEAVMLTEGDVAAAQAPTQKIPSITGLPKLIIKLPPRPPTKHGRPLRKNVERLVNPRRKGEMRMMSMRP